MKPDWLGWPEIKLLAKAFATQQAELRFVGGCVRDSVLGRAVSDIDMATSLPPQQVMEIGEAAGIKMMPTGLKHGTVTAVVDGRQIEITTLRRDAACDGRHAEVEFTGSWEEDARRRDFTMNALYLSFTGELFDYTNGQADAKAGQVRFIGAADERISEDYLRILRFFRFFAHYGKVPADKEALAACRLGKAALAQLSGERIQQEMLKLLAAENPIPALALMEETGVLAMLLKAARLQPLTSLLALEKQTDVIALPPTRLATLFAANEIEATAGRWKLSNAMRQELLRLHGQEIKMDMPEAGQKKILRSEGRAAFEQSVLFSWARSGGDYAPMLELAQNWLTPEFPITGDDLKKLGFEEGKPLGIALKTLEEQWERSDYSLSREALLKAVSNK